MRLLLSLRGRLQRSLIGVRMRWTYALGAAGLAYGLITIVVQPPGGLASTGVALFFTLLAVIAFRADSARIRREVRELHAVEVDPDRLTALRMTDTYSDFAIYDFRDLRAIYSQDLNDVLPTMRNPVARSGDAFRLPEPVRQPAVRAFILRRAFSTRAVLFDAPKVRLVTDITHGAIEAGEPIAVEKTSYFKSLCTNEVVTLDIFGQSGDGPVMAGPELVANNTYYEDLETSRCSNHIGIGTLAFTEDGHVVVTVQAASSAQSPSLLAPSGAGSADTRDLHAGEAFRDFLCRAMERELTEECGIDQSTLRAPMRTLPIGYARFLMRGGKPEFFGLTFLPTRSGDLRQVPRKERVFIADIRPARVNPHRLHELVRTLRVYRTENDARLSLPLALHLEFLIRFIERQPVAFSSLVTGA